MIHEIEPILRYWLQIADRMNVQREAFEDSRERVQISLDNVVYYRLLLQGRPDGLMAKGFVSFLHFYESEVRTLLKNGEDVIFSDVEQKRLAQEILCYFPRSIALLKLGDYGACAQDVHHCLKVAEFASRYSANSHIVDAYNRMMPTLHMLYYFALAAMSLNDIHFGRALYYLDRGIQRILLDYLRYRVMAAEAGYGEINRLKSFKRSIIKVMRKRQKRGSYGSDISRSSFARRSSPHNRICHLLSRNWPRESGA